MGNNPPPSRKISIACRRQQGNITRAQILAQGLSDDFIESRLRSGWLFREHNGVYSVGRPATTLLERASAAVLACGHGAALCDASAMVLWGFWKRWEEPFHVVVPGDRRRPGIKVHRRTLGPFETTVHHGIRVTTAARTMLDVLPQLPADGRNRTVDGALHTLWLTRGHLVETALRHPGHPGAKLLVPFVTTDSGPSRSDWERWFPAWCETHDLPPPVMNAKIGPHHTVDALWPQAMPIVELDSWQFHQSRTAFEDDRERDAYALAHGYATVRITWDRMLANPVREANRLRSIIAARCGRRSA